MKKERQGDLANVPDQGIDIPASLASMASKAGPVRVVSLDVNQPLPDIRADDHYHAAYVAFLRDGVYYADTLIDLDQDQETIQGKLRDIIARVELIAPYEQKMVPDDKLPRATVVVPTIVTRLEALRRCLDHIANLDYPDFEVVLVDNRQHILEPDPLPEIVKGLSWLRVVREPRPGVSAARNAGIASTNREIIAFTDDDVSVDRGWLRALATRMANDERLDVVSGLTFPFELESPAQVWFERYYGGFNGQRSFVAKTLEVERRKSRLLRGSRVLAHDPNGVADHIFAIYGVGAYGAGANMAFRRAALERLGGFDVALGTGTKARGGEDLAAFITILWEGGVMGYEPTAVASHQHRRTYQDLLSLMQGAGVGFTAMLTSLVCRDPRHIVALVSKMPVAIRKAVVQLDPKVRGMSTTTARSRSTDALYPSVLAKREILNYFRGPWAYFASRSAWKKLVRPLQ